MEDLEILQIKPGEPLYTKCLHLRNEVLRIPIGLSLFDEDLSQEINDIFLVAVTSSRKPQNDVQHKKVIGCIKLEIYTGDSSSMTYRIRQMAVSPEYQGKGIGSMLVGRAEMFCRESGKKRLYLHGRKHAVGFYQKMGYEIISEEFLESNIPHFALEKVLLDNSS